MFEESAERKERAILTMGKSRGERRVIFSSSGAIATTDGLIDLTEEGILSRETEEGLNGVERVENMGGIMERAEKAIGGVSSAASASRNGNHHISVLSHRHNFSFQIWLVGANGPFSGRLTNKFHTRRPTIDPNHIRPNKLVKPN